MKEDVSSVEVCVVMTGMTTPEVIQVSLYTQDGTALGKDGCYSLHIA